MEQKQKTFEKFKYILTGKKVLGSVKFVAIFLAVFGAVALAIFYTNQPEKFAKAEDIIATVPVTGNFTANLLLSPDGSTAYVSNSGYTATAGISKYNTSDNTLTSFLAIGENQIILNSTGSKLYAFTTTDIKVIDTASFSIESTISRPNVGAGFLSIDDSKIFVVTGTNEVSVLDTSNNSVITTIETLLPNSTNGISITNSASLNGSGFVNSDKTKLYLIGNFNTAIIDIATNTFEGFIPIDTANASLNSRGVSISQDGSKIYSPDPLGFRVIDLVTNKLERIIVGSRADFIQSGADKIFVMDNLKTIKIYDSQTFKLISENVIFSDLTNLQINSLVVSPDNSKIYITGIRSGGVTYIGNPQNLTPIFGPSDNFLMVVDLNTFEINVNGGFNSNAKIQRFTSDGKKVYITDQGSYKVIDTTLVNSSDISSFECTSPTNTLGSIVTCTVNTSGNVRGLVKFDVGLESCIAYFAPSGGSTASCTYVANNIQTSSITVNPSFGNPATNGTLTINGGANDITISASNIVSNNNCTISGNVKISTEFDCSFFLTGSISNSYILPSGGIKIGVNGASDRSDQCSIIGNGTSNATLDCKNIPSFGAGAGSQNIQSFINNSTTGNNSGSIILTDGFLVNSTTDTIDEKPGDGYCGDVNGDCTLRAAVMESNAVFDKDKITIPAGVYQLTITPTDTPNTTENKGAIDGDLDVTSDIDFIGAGKDSTYIQAGTDSTNGIDRVFHIFNTNVNFNDLSIRYGRANNQNVPSYFNGVNFTTEIPRNGGGIYYQKFKDFESASFNVQPENPLEIFGYNQSFGFNGTGQRIYEFETTFNLTDVAVVENFAQNSGGGVYNASTLSKFTNSNISNNISGLYGGGLSRAGVTDRVFTISYPNSSSPIKIFPVAVLLPSTKLEIVNSIISQNQSTDGGGFYHDRGNKIYIDENSQILSNVATNRGGGLYNAELLSGVSLSTITITGATISSNSANQGGGIYNESGHVETLPGNLTSKNTLIQYNSAVQGSAWYTLSGLSEATNTSIYESNTQNPNFDYNSARIQTSAFRIESGDLKINKSLLLGNWGRGVEVNGGNVTIDNTTIDSTSGRAVSSSNGPNAPDNGNGIAITNSTLTRGNASAIYLGDNKTSFSGRHLTIIDNSFGITVNQQSLGNIQLDNTLIGRSFFKNCADIAGTDLTTNIGNSSRGANLANNSDCNLVFGFNENPDILNFLGPLAFNGGPTLTMALLSGNPAIDGGSGSLTYNGFPASPETDQRGLPRINGLNPDVGAYEAQISLLAVNDDISTNANSSVNIDVTANDIGGEFGIDLNQVVDNQYPNYGDISNSGSGNFTYTPNLSQLQNASISQDNTITDTFTYYFFDNNGSQSNSATVTITINLNSPEAVNDSATTTTDSSVDINVLANDIGGTFGINSNSVNIQDFPAKGNLVDNGGGNYTYTPDPLQFTTSGTDTFTYNFSDQYGRQTNTATVSIVVNVLTIPNVLPVASNDSATTLVSSSVLIDVPSNDTDSDGTLDLSSVTIVTSPTRGNVVINPTTGVATYTPTVSSFITAGTDTFTYRIRDNDGGLSNVATVTINVSLPPQPLANPDTATTPESTPITIDVLTNDVNSTNICVGSISGVSNGTAVISSVSGGDRILFTPTIGYVGNTSFSYTACSTVVGTNPSSPATVTVNVTAVNPIAVNDTATVNENENVTINVLANDSDPSGQTLSICSPLSTPSNGSISKTTVNGVEQIVFTPTPGFSGNTSFTYTACDPAGNPSNVASVSVVVVERVVQNIQLTLFKSKPNDQILVNDPIQIQADIKNPNNFSVEKIETIIRIDTAKLKLVPNSLRSGSITGEKFSSLLNRFTGPIEVLAQSSTTTFEVLSDAELKVTILNAAPNQIIPVIFDVIPQATLENSIQGTSNIIDTQTNQPLATSNAQVTLQAAELPQIIQRILVRTGGEISTQIATILLIVGLIFAYSHKKRSVPVE